jgi:hypothetical protein
MQSSTPGGHPLRAVSRNPEAQRVGKRRFNNFPFGAFIPLENAQGDVFVVLHGDVREEGLVCVIDSMCNR